MSNSTGVSRRDFLKAGVAAGALTGAGLGGFYFGYDKAIGSPVRVGVIGTGDEGSVLIGALNPSYVEVKAIADVRPFNQFRAFHGDWTTKDSKPSLLPVRPGLMSIYGWKSQAEADNRCKTFGPYQDLLENAKKLGIEAVIIATPLHLHAQIAIEAMKQGLHVITEKLMAQTVGQCKEMTRVSESQRVYLAIGHQRHYNIKYWQAKDWIQRGLLGEVHSIRAQWHRGNLPPPDNDSWQIPLPPGVGQESQEDKMKVKLVNEIAKTRRAMMESYGSDTEGWIKVLSQLEAQMDDAQLTAMDKKQSAIDPLEFYKGKTVKDAAGKPAYECSKLEELIRWRLWDNTGAGMMAELGSHQLDAASIFVSALYPEENKGEHGKEGEHHPRPLRVVAAANRPIFDFDRDIEDHVCCIIEFPLPDYDKDDKKLRRRKIDVQYASINGNGYLNYGELVYGTKGTLALEKEQDLKLITGSGDDGEGETAVKVTGGGGGPTLDTQSSGPVRKTGGAAEGPVSRGYAEELEHWAWCIRHPDPKNKPRCHPRVAMADAIIALTTNLAVRTGQSIDFREEWFDPSVDDTPEKDLKINV